MEFQIGDKVKLSKYGIDHLKYSRIKELRGTIVGFSWDRKCVRIRRDDTPKHYTHNLHKSFVEKTAIGKK